MEKISKTTPYFSMIDTLRALSVIAVILFHLPHTYFKSGLVGVDIFFVISGFVVSLSVQNLAQQDMRQFLTAFYTRRVKRIIPPLLVMLTVTMALYVLFIPSAFLSTTIPDTGKAAVFGLSNWQLHVSDSYFAPRSEFNPFTHTWSLGVEEQFYLIFPLAYFFISQLSKHLRFAVLSLVWIASIVLTSTQNETFYLLPFRAWELISGIIAFEVFKNGWLPKLRLNWFGLALFLLLLVALFQPNSVKTPLPGAVIPVILTAILLIAIANNRSETYLTKILSLPTLNHLGKLSYSLYLWHWPIFTLARWTTGLDTLTKIILALILTYTISSLSYYFLELPIRKIETSGTKKQVQWLTGNMAVLLAALLLFSFMSTNKNRISLAQSDRDTNSWGYYDYKKKDCHLVEEVHKYQNMHYDVLTSSCNTDKNINTFYAVGDSHMLTYQYLYSYLAHEMNFKIIKISDGECPLFRLDKPALNSKCAHDVTEKLNFLKAHLKQNDFLFLPSLRMPRLGDQWEYWGHDKLDFFKLDAINKRSQAITEAADLIEYYQLNRAKVIFEGSKPLFKNPPFRCHDWFNSMNAACVHSSKIEKNELLPYKAEIDRALHILQRRNSNVFVWPIFDLLCPGDKCDAFDGSTPLFFDGDHLTTGGVKLLVDDFKKILASKHNL